MNTMNVYELTCIIAKAKAYEDAIVLARKIVKDTAHERMEKDLQNVSRVRAQKGEDNDTK